MREIKLVLFAFVMPTLIIPFNGCSKTEDEEKKTSTNTEQSAVPAQHKVISTVHEFIKAIDTGDYDRAIELSAPNKFNRERLISINGGYIFNNVEIVGAYVSNKNSVVLASPIFTIGQAKERMHFGFSLVKSGKRWIIHRMYIHYFLDDAQKWLDGFKDVEPAAQRVASSD
jgi:hypothetical protein